MRRYLLDSDTLSYLQQPDSPFYPAVSTRIAQLTDEDEVFLSILSLYEMSYGVSWGPAEDRPYFLRAIEKTEQMFPVMPLARAGAAIFGDLKTKYRHSTGALGKSLKRNDIDFILASTAIAENATLVSNDKIFEVVQQIEPTLQLENWAA
jgi:predicted nucleic acid-binding protein